MLGGGGGLDSRERWEESLSELCRRRVSRKEREEGGEGPQRDLERRERGREREAARRAAGKHSRTNRCFPVGWTLSKSAVPRLRMGSERH